MNARSVESMTVKCKNCSVQGTLSLYQGFFSVQNTRESEQNESMIIEFFKEDGFLELQADNVAAHIELESSVNPSVGLGAIEIPLPSIGLPGFTVSGREGDWNASARLTFRATDSWYSHRWSIVQASHRDGGSIVGSGRFYLRV